MGSPNKKRSITSGRLRQRLKSILDAQFKNGKLVTIYVPQRFANDIDIPSDRSPEPSDPWIANMGIFQDDPTFDDFLAEVSTYRNEITSGRLRQRYRREPFMTVYVPDTDLLSLYQRNHPQVCARIRLARQIWIAAEELVESTKN